MKEPMKKLVLTGLLLISISLSAQNKDYHCDIYQQDSTTGQYGTLPIATRDMWYNPDGTEKRNMYMYETGGQDNQYDYENGFLVSQVYYLYDAQSRTWSLPNRYRWFKDNKDRDTLVLNETQANSPGTYKTQSSSKLIYTEDSLGRVTFIEAWSYSYWTNQWIKDSERVFHYSGSDTAPDEFWYTYYSNGVTSFSHHWYGLQFLNGYTFSLHPYPNIAYKEEWKNGKWNLKYYDSTTLDPKDQYQYSFLFDTVSQSFQLNSLFYQKYDLKGRTLVNYSLKFENGQADTSYRSMSVHEEDGNGDLSVSYVYIRSAYTGVNNLKYVYSKPLSSQNRITSKLTVFPNPIAANGQIRLPEGDWNAAELFSMNGKKYALEHEGSGKFRVPAIAPGIYFIQATNRAGQVHQARIQVR